MAGQQEKNSKFKTKKRKNSGNESHNIHIKNEAQK